MSGVDGSPTSGQTDRVEKAKQAPNPAAVAEATREVDSMFEKLLALVKLLIPKGSHLAKALELLELVKKECVAAKCNPGV